jgi:hypothetical protein
MSSKSDGYALIGLVSIALFVASCVRPASEDSIRKTLSCPGADPICAWKRPADDIRSIHVVCRFWRRGEFGIFPSTVDAPTRIERRNIPWHVLYLVVVF